VDEDTTALFGLAGFRVRHVERDQFGVRTVHVQTDDETAAGCPSCGVILSSVKGEVSTAPRDVPYGDGLISIVWHKRRWRCVEPLCGRLSFTESVPEVPPRSRTTGLLRRAAGSAVADACRSVAEVAQAFGVSWPTAHAAVIELAARELGDPEPTLALGIDETRRGRPRWHQEPESGRWVRTDAWDTGFADLAGTQGLLGQVEGRTSACVVDWLNARSREFRAGIRWVAIDPAAVYAKAVGTPGLLPNAVLVVDHFHVVALANAAVTAVRRRVVWEQQGRRGRKARRGRTGGVC
jgi:transposase